MGDESVARAAGGGEALTQSVVTHWGRGIKACHLEAGVHPLLPPALQDPKHLLFLNPWPQGHRTTWPRTKQEGWVLCTLWHVDGL